MPSRAMHGGAPAGTFLFEISPLGARLMGLYGLLWTLLFGISRWLPGSLASALRLPGRPQGPQGFEVPTSYPLAESLVLHPPGALLDGPGFQLWQLMSAPFAYPPAAFGSLVLAFVGFGFFAAPVERYLGRADFLKLWFGASFGAALCATIFAVMVGPSGPHWGVGPAVVAVLLVSCLMTPEATVPFFLVLPVRMKWIAWGVTAWVVVRALAMTQPLGEGPLAGGYELGGVAVAWLWMRRGSGPLRWLRRWRARRLVRVVADDLSSEGGGDEPVFH